MRPNNAKTFLRVTSLSLVLGACAYRAPGGDTPSDASTSDNPATGDAATDGTTASPCSIAIAGGETDAPPIGGDGGSQRADAVCAAGELPIGLGFDVSQDTIDNHNDQVAMVNVRVRCANIERYSDGAFHTTPNEQFTSMGGMGGNCNAYFPTTVADEVVCPDGQVMVGISGNRLDDTLYNTVAITCATLASDGTPTTTTTTLAVAGTGAESNQPMSSACDAATAISSFAIRSGCGHDQLKPRCAPLVCQ